MGSVYLMSDGILNYYGSTKDRLSDRLTCHKAPTNNCSTKLMNKDKMTIVEVERVEELEQLKIRENWFIKNNECVNKHAAITSKEEKLAQHRARSKKYYEANKQKCYEADVRSRIKRGEYDKITCECGSIMNKGEMTRHKKSIKHINYLNSV